MTSEGMSLRKQVIHILKNPSWKTTEQENLVVHGVDDAITADRILRLVAEEVERMPKTENLHAHEVNMKNPDVGIMGLARGFVDGTKAERAHVVALLKKG